MKYQFYFFLALTLIGACKPRQNRIVKHHGKPDLISFKPVFGVNYFEVYRRTGDGLSFNDAGYQLEPQWQIDFLSNDSAAIYSPIKQKIINFPLTCGYDSIFNTARTWFKVRKMNKDSLKVELLEAYSDTIDTKGTNVFLTFYSENHITNHLHTTVAKLRRPSRKDSLYIFKLSKIANSDYTKAFAARQPVRLVSNSKDIKVEKRSPRSDFFNNFDTSDSYMIPTFDIVINHAYKNFFYSFTAIVDAEGNMHYGKPLIPAHENYIKMSKAIMDGYLKYYLKIIPGKTLDVIHASEISFHVKGLKAAKESK